LLPVAEDDSERFERVAREYGAALARLAAVYAPERADRDDLSQEILLAIWRALPRFRGESSERTFVFRVAHNRGITYRSRRRRHPPPPPEEDRGAREVPDTALDPAAQLERARRHERLVAAVSRLPGPLRLAVLLHLEGLSHREIAAVQGITEENVAVRLTRARKALRLLLGQEHREMEP
jgi:RNA polymerase sigma factor (sigma-70 family)